MPIQKKYSSPHDFVIIREESLRNRYDEVFYILTEVNQKGLFTENTHELCLALMAIAESVPEYENEEVNKFFENFKLSTMPTHKSCDQEDNPSSAIPPVEPDSESEGMD